MGTTATARSADRGAAETLHRMAGRVGSGLRRPYAVDFAVALGFLAVAIWVGQGLLPDPATRELAYNPEDQVLIEWFLAVDTRVLLAEQGLVTDRLNVPAGMNMLANATSLTLGFLLAPVTLTLGAPVSFAVITIGNLAGTALAWYLLFSRTLRTSRTAAAVGGAFCGFAPAMISQSNSHWHMTAQWLVPAIVWSVVRLARAADAATTTGATADEAADETARGADKLAGKRADEGAATAARRRVVTSGLLLAGFVVVQYFLGAEVLYLTAFTLALLVIPYALLRRAWARRILRAFVTGMAVATGVATLLLAYPLWVQFAGPGSVRDGPFSPYYYSADLASWPAFSPLTIAGSEATADLATGHAEYNTFFGWPLLLVTVGCVVWLRHRPLAAAAAIAAGLMAILSLGPELIVHHTRTELRLPYLALVDKPVVDGALPQRYAMAAVPPVALLLALALDRARAATHRVRLVVPAAIGLALLPLFPTPLPAANREPVPEFISGGHWRECVPPGGVMVPVPPPVPRQPEPMRWAAAANAEFGMPEGFFIGPYGAGGTASMGIYPRATSRLLAKVATTGQAPVITPEQQAQAEKDIAYWGADCVVLGPGQEYEAQLRATLVELLGAPGRRVADAWVWPTAG